MRFATVVAVLALGAFGSSRAAAFPVPHPHNTPHMSEVAQLHSVKVLLEHADHDYKGHRAAAVKHITAAIHELHPHHHATRHPSAPHPKSANKTKPHEPQKLSDAQLRAAIQKLEGVHTQLAHHTSGNGHKAAGHVSHAISELKTALTIK